MSKENAYHSLLFGVCRSIRYNSRRQAFYEALDRLTTFFLLLLGSGTVAVTLRDSHAYVLVVVGFAVSFISGIKLVYAFGDKASKHAQFVKDFTRLEKKLRANHSAETVAEVTQERLEIEAVEPPVRHALNVLCHNELAQAMGYDNEEMYKVRAIERWTANYFGWGGSRFRKICT